MTPGKGVLVHVECYAGGRGEETPRRMFWRDRWEDLTVEGRCVRESPQGGAQVREFAVRVANGREGMLPARPDPGPVAVVSGTVGWSGSVMYHRGKSAQ
jgi:hypothetical protein